MKQTIKHINKIILIILAMQVLNNGLFAQDVFDTHNESILLHSITSKIENGLHQKKASLPKQQHKQSNKHHQHTLKQSSVKYITHSIFEFHKFDISVVKVSNDYPLYFSSYCEDIAPPPPKI
jgi:hypothetical protein